MVTWSFLQSEPSRMSWNNPSSDSSPDQHHGKNLSGGRTDGSFILWHHHQAGAVQFNGLLKLKTSVKLCIHYALFRASVFLPSFLPPSIHPSLPFYLCRRLGGVFTLAKLVLVGCVRPWRSLRCSPTSLLMKLPLSVYINIVNERAMQSVSVVCPVPVCLALHVFPPRECLCKALIPHGEGWGVTHGILGKT